MVECLHYLASIVNVNICAYAIISNHYHLILNWSVGVIGFTRR
jgi:hypothetical protein